MRSALACACAVWCDLMLGSPLPSVENTSMLTLEEKNEILSMPTARPEYLTAKAKRQLGNELLASGDVQGAIQMYTTAIDMCPGD